MATATTDAPPKAKATMLDRIGAGGSVLSFLALAVPVGYTVYANTNTVTLNTSDDVKSLLTNGIIITGAAAAVGLIATVLNVPGLLKNRSVGHIAATGVSALVLIASVLFLVLGLLPRVTPLNHLSNDLQPFGDSLTTNCSKPLTQTTRDEHQIWVDASITLSQAAVGDASADGNFVKYMTADVAVLQSDVSALTSGANALGQVTAPDSKYQDLLMRCIGDLKATADFLSNDGGSKAIQLSSSLPKMSLITLLQNSTKILTGQLTLPPNTLPAGVTVEEVIAGVMGGDAKLLLPASGSVLCASDPQLTSDGNQLYNDAVNILTTNTAPFKPNVDNIIGTNAPSVNYCKGS